MNNIDVGFKGQILAEEYLKGLGYKILERNYRSKRWGEIDIIALDAGTLVFVEVKTRLVKSYGNPEEAVSYYKLRALRRTANYYILQNNLTIPQRIDIVAISKLYNKFKIEHFKLDE